MTLECPRCKGQMDLVEALRWYKESRVSTNTYYCPKCLIYTRLEEDIDKKPPPRIFLSKTPECSDCQKEMTCVMSEPSYAKPGSIQNHYFFYCYVCEEVAVTRRTRKEWIITHYTKGKQEKKKIYDEP